MIFDDTIAAISTPAGAGAIAIVRLSGTNAWTIAQKIFSPSGPTDSTDTPEMRSHTASHGFVKQPSTNNIVDEVVLIPYKGPHSYTGEDLVEINCHGSPYITNALLDLCLSQGARLARPGEFTQRAFLSGRIDLTQAEAVLDLIHSRTGRQSKQALSALTGEIGAQIEDVRNSLLELLSRVVAGIDFPEEVGEIPLDDVGTVVKAALDRLSILARTVRSGRFLRQGLRLAIVGKPNAGKSSLLNQLLQFERAIVTDVPGTTRDSLEEQLDLHGIPVILVDTAGIRKTEDHVEQIGIERTYKTIESADLALLVTDVTTGWTTDDDLIAKMLAHVPYMVLANKIDLAADGAVFRSGSAGILPAPDQRPGSRSRVSASTTHETAASSPVSAVSTSAPQPSNETPLPISATSGRGIPELTAAIETWIFSDGRSKDAGASLNARQGELCNRAIEALQLVEETVRNDMPQDCLATDLKTAVDCLSEICGEAVSEEIISNVFARFCIGK
ncbi:MAG TPA: tRNA uridine-5-carboxymethylaminomethyl(34) synthesis GTPase MnmE [Planktothrix sp.]|jgi:tRNA modification GTPase